MSDSKVNPANEVEGIPVGFRPMTSAVLRLQVPERSGFHRHWFRGTPERINRAMQAGYKFVDDTGETVNVRSFDLAGDSNKDGNSDLGSRISVISGDDLESNGQPGRLYLMECPNHLYEIGQKILAERNESVAEAIRGGTTGKLESGETSGDVAKRYVKGTVPDLFNPSKRRT